MFNFPSNCVVRKSLKKQEKTKGFAVTRPLKKAVYSTVPCLHICIFLFLVREYDQLSFLQRERVCRSALRRARVASSNICPACLLTNKAWGSFFHFWSEQALKARTMAAGQWAVNVGLMWDRRVHSHPLLQGMKEMFLSSLHMFIEKKGKGKRRETKQIV